MEQVFLVGTYSKNGIYKLKFNNGVLSTIKIENSFENCSWLLKNGNIIYSVVEYSDNPVYENGYLTARNSELLPINSSSVCGKSPCHIAIDKVRHLLFLANYGSGSIDVFKLNKDVTINKKIYYKEFTKQSHIHYISISPENRFLFAIDLGTDTIFSYEIFFDGTNLNLKEFFHYTFPFGSGPRHLVLNQNNLFVITENSCELYKLSFSPEKGFDFINCVSILPAGIKKEENFTGCAIKISNDKKFLYTSIRGHNSISVFDVSNLELIQNISCFGETPRDINFDNSEDYLLCANQSSSSITVFERNKKTGYLNYVSSYPINSPACII